jgi:hypothetical protein
MTTLFNSAFSIITKFAVSNSTLWALGITVFLKLFDIFIDWHKADKETKKNYIEFLTKMAAKGLVSVKIKESAEAQYKALNNPKT